MRDWSIVVVVVPRRAKQWQLCVCVVLTLIPSCLYFDLSALLLIDRSLLDCSFCQCKPTISFCSCVTREHLLSRMLLLWKGYRKCYEFSTKQAGLKRDIMNRVWTRSVLSASGSIWMIAERKINNSGMLEGELLVTGSYCGLWPGLWSTPAQRDNTLHWDKPPYLDPLYCIHIHHQILC